MKTRRVFHKHKCCLSKLANALKSDHQLGEQTDTQMHGQMDRQTEAGQVIPESACL